MKGKTHIPFYIHQCVFTDMKDLIFRQYTSKQIKPEGWLYRQLRLQADGLEGNLDKIWRDVRDSKWVKGDAEGWERVPYWLDGFIPLAYLLDDADLMSRADRYVTAILEGQRPDGWICPCEDNARGSYDVWAGFLIMKALLVYYDCTGKKEVLDAVYKAARAHYLHMRGNTLFNWGSSRWFEGALTSARLYEEFGEDWLIDFAYLLDAQGLDYEKLYKTSGVGNIKEKHYWSYRYHVVNTGMMLKSRAVMSRFTDESPTEAFDMMYGQLTKYHGMPTGHFSGDECLSGTLPIQGSELCSVTEAMYSYEKLIEIAGDVKFSDLLEKEAYNCLPATCSADMWTHQYDQMTNQMSCTYLKNEDNPFTSNGGEAHLFGLEPNYGCCTANLSQGWPKFALSVLSSFNGGIALNVFAPVSLTTSIGGADVKITVKTDYPFEDGLMIEVKTSQPVEFKLKIRIPDYADEAFVDGDKVKTGEYYELERIWSDDTVDVLLKLIPVFERRPSGMYVVRRGALLFSIPIQYKKRMHEFERGGVIRKYPYCDYEYIPESDWNFAFYGSGLPDVTFGKVPEMPFDVNNAPIKMTVNAVKIPWEEEGGVCRAVPESNTPLSSPEKITLQPYGCTDLRMTELPLIDKI